MSGDGSSAESLAPHQSIVSSSTGNQSSISSPSRSSSTDSVSSETPSSLQALNLLSSAASEMQHVPLNQYNSTSPLRSAVIQPVSSPNIHMISHPLSAIQPTSRLALASMNLLESSSPSPPRSYALFPSRLALKQGPFYRSTHILVSRLDDGTWECADGQSFSTQHQAYRHLRSLRGQRKDLFKRELRGISRPSPLRGTSLSSEISHDIGQKQTKDRTSSSDDLSDGEDDANCCPRSDNVFCVLDRLIDMSTVSESMSIYQICQRWMNPTSFWNREEDGISEFNKIPPRFSLFEETSNDAKLENLPVKHECLQPEDDVKIVETKSQTIADAESLSSVANSQFLNSINSEKDIDTLLKDYLSHWKRVQKSL